MENRWFISLASLMRRKKLKLPPRVTKPTSPIDLIGSDEHATYEIGSPFYGTASNRSGLGWIESQAELARFEGTLIRCLFTGKFHLTKEPFALIGILLLAIFWAIIPITLVLAAVLLDRSVPIVTLLLVGAPNVLIGIFALISAGMSILAWTRKKKMIGSKRSTLDD